MKLINQKATKHGLHIIILGGTIDFEANTFTELKSDNVDVLFPRKYSVIPKFLMNRVKYSYNDLHFSRIDMVDSRDITEDHLKALVNEISKSPYQQILVTMGIVKIEDIKKYIDKKIPQFKSKIVGLVGSRQPLSNYKSDGGFHLGYAIGKMQNCKPGLYSFHPDKNKIEVEKILKNVVFIITGGTIESYYDETKGQEIPYASSHIPEYFKKSIGINLDEPDFVFRIVSLKDSRNLTQTDYSNLLRESFKHPYKKQIIIGGTYGLPDMGSRYSHLFDANELPNNSYVFMGSMFPEDTYLNDGWFNMGYTLGKITDLDEGVMLSMHGWTTRPPNIWKQLNEGKFLLHNNKIKL